MDLFLEDIKALLYTIFSWWDSTCSIGDILTMVHFTINDGLRLVSPNSLVKVLPIIRTPLQAILDIISGTIGNLPIIGSISDVLINGPKGKSFSISDDT